MIFLSIQPYLTDPLIVLSACLLLMFLTIKFAIPKHLIKKRPQYFDNKKTKWLLQHGYVIAILFLLLSMYYKNNQLQSAEHQRAKAAVQAEYQDNLTHLAHIKKTSQWLLQSHQKSTAAFRSSNSLIMKQLFQNFGQPSGDQKKSIELAFQSLARGNVFKNDSTMKAFQASKMEIRKTMVPLTQQLNQWQKENQQTHIDDTFWQSHKALLFGTDDFDALAYEHALLSLNNIKKQYGHTLNKVNDFNKELMNFIERNSFVSNGSIHDIYSKEQKAWAAINQLSAEIAQGELTMNQ